MTGFATDKRWRLQRQISLGFFFCFLSEKEGFDFFGAN